MSLALLLLVPGHPFAQEGERGARDLPDLKTLTSVPVIQPTPARPPSGAEGDLDEEAWRKRFRDLRFDIDRKERLLAIKRAELYDKLEKGETEKKPRRFAIEGFVINTEKPGGEPRYIDPLEREVHERDEELAALKRQLRDLDFQASMAGVPKQWRK